MSIGQQVEYQTPISINQRLESFKTFIREYLRQRLEEKLAKATAGQREKLRRKYEPAFWLADAAKRVAQLKAVTHSLKAVHSKASGTNLFCRPASLSRTDLLGSHALPENFHIDVVGNGAALDVYKFLRQVHEGRTLLDWLEAGDPDALAALSAEPEKSVALAEAFLNLKEQTSALASHTLAKQVYWLTGNEPTYDSQFHLLAPLYPTSLVHYVFQKVQDHRFGEEAKEAREAKKNKTWHENEARDYPNLAIQKIGGAYPTNVSFLNSERKGVNYLFPSLPPMWINRLVRPPKGDSLCEAFGQRPATSRLIRDFKIFLDSNPKPNQETRKKRNQYLADIIDEFIVYASKLKLLPPGWTKEASCRLPQEEKDWLEPNPGVPGGSADQGQPDEISNKIIRCFANWLNSILDQPLPAGEVEQAFWTDALKEAGFDQQA